jgi:hypothetical protein
LKKAFGAWNDFSSEFDQSKKISCDEAGLLLGRKLQANSIFTDINRKEG